LGLSLSLILHVFNYWLSNLVTDYLNILFSCTYFYCTTLYDWPPEYAEVLID